MNALLGQKIAAVSPRPQTTRKRQLGIFTTERGQIIFVDAPGIHKPHHKLGEAMNYEALSTWEDVDLILFMVDGANLPHPEDRLVADFLQQTAKDLPVLIVFNKIDLTPKDRREAYQAMYRELLPGAPLIPISALTNEGWTRCLKPFTTGCRSARPTTTRKPSPTSPSGKLPPT